MKKILILLITFNLFFISSLTAEMPVEKQLLSAEDSLKILDTIKDKAIIFGSGEKEVHTFIDPNCEMSRRYFEFILQKQDVMFKKYTIYLYLYELPGKNSKELINTILASEYKNTILKSVMINNDDIILDSFDDDAGEAVNQIANVAKTIGVFKRPYIMINGKVK